MLNAPYLARIHYTGSLVPTLATLAGLQKSHLLHVPFENLDIHLGRRIDPLQSYDKIVQQHRGGFCYELNSLFYALLCDLGFTVTLISACVFDKAKGYGPEFDHMAIIATIDGKEYLVDVGFGEFTFAPLPIVPDVLQEDVRGQFLITTEDNTTYLVLKHGIDAYLPQYRFTKTARVVSDFLGMCHFHQTHAESHFTQKPLCSLPTENGRISLTGNVLKITDNGKVTETILHTEQEHASALLQHFHMRI